MLHDIQRHHHATRLIIILCISALVLTALTLALLYYFEHRSNGPISHISLGSLEYTLQDDHYVKRSDTSANELRSFLEDLNRTSGCTENVYHEVIAATPDEKQALLRFGCDAATSRMFAVNTGSEWQTLSPTNQFDQFGIPLCDHVSSNNISRTIAPVCVIHVVGSDPEYLTR